MERIAVELNVLVKSSLSMKCGPCPSFMPTLIYFFRCCCCFDVVVFSGWKKKRERYESALNAHINAMRFHIQRGRENSALNLICVIIISMWSAIFPVCTKKVNGWQNAIKRCCVYKSIQQYLIAYARWRRIDTATERERARENCKKKKQQPPRMNHKIYTHRGARARASAFICNKTAAHKVIIAEYRMNCSYLSKIKIARILPIERSRPSGCVNGVII